VLLYNTSNCSVTMLFACMLRLSGWEQPETLDFAAQDCHLLQMHQKCAFKTQMLY